MEFEDVWAAYVPGQYVLQGVSFRAAPGETVAIVGPTGAGKTTIINLIPRFYDAIRGAVQHRRHGRPRRDRREPAAPDRDRPPGHLPLQRHRAEQHPLRAPRAPRTRRCRRAARLAHAHDFIERLPQGYQTVLGERGSGLSQGQRQLLAIARAALADPRILILDEATSSVDTRTERQIQRALETLLAGRTSFVIAHRLSTIRHADQVLVVDGGQIVERGTHQELLDRRGAYYDLYMRQFLRPADGPADGAAPRPAPTAPA